MLVTPTSCTVDRQSKEETRQVGTLVVRLSCRHCFKILSPTSLYPFPLSSLSSFLFPPPPLPPLPRAHTHHHTSWLICKRRRNVTFMRAKHPLTRWSEQRTTRYTWAHKSHVHIEVGGTGTVLTSAYTCIQEGSEHSNSEAHSVCALFRGIGKDCM